MPLSFKLMIWSTFGRCDKLCVTRILVYNNKLKRSLENANRYLSKLALTPDVLSHLKYWVPAEVQIFKAQFRATNLRTLVKIVLTIWYKIIPSQPRPISASGPTNSKSFPLISNKKEWTTICWGICHPKVHSTSDGTRLSQFPGNNVGVQYWFEWIIIPSLWVYLRYQ